MPAEEEGRPVDVVDQLFQVDIVEDLDAGEVGLRRLVVVPVDSHLVVTGFGQRDILFSRAAVFAAFAHTGVLLFGIQDKVGARIIILTDEGADDGDGAGGVEHVHHRTRIFRFDLNGGMHLGSGGAADEQRQFEALALHLLGDVDHLVERRGDQAAEADDVDLFFLRGAQDFFCRHHDAHVDDIVVITAQHHADDVLADIVHIAFDGSEQHFAFGFAGLAAAGFFLFNIRSEVGDRLFHDAGAFDHLWEEHLSGAEEITDHVHAVHQGPFDDGERRGVFLPGFLRILDDEIGDASDEGVRQSFFHRRFPPAEVFLEGAAALAFDFFGVFGEAVGGVGAAVEEHVLHALEQVLGDVFVHLDYARVDDAHVHTCLNSVVEEGRVHSFADRVVAAEGEGNIADPAADFGAGAQLFDAPCGFDKVDGVVVVFFDAGSDGEDVGVEDDVLRFEAHLFGEDFIGADADFDFAVGVVGLALLIEGHDDGGGPVAAYDFGLADKFLFAFFE